MSSSHRSKVLRTIPLPHLLLHHPTALYQHVLTRRVRGLGAGKVSQREQEAIVLRLIFSQGAGVILGTGPSLQRAGNAYSRTPDSRSFPGGSERERFAPFAEAPGQKGVCLRLSTSIFLHCLPSCLSPRPEKLLESWKSKSVIAGPGGTCPSTSAG